MDLPLLPPFKPMLAKLTRTIPEGDGWLFEPKWDGFRCIVFRDGDEIELTSRKERPFTRYFPELLDPLRGALPTRCVIDGEIVIADRDGNGLDFDALLQRIHPAESRIRRLAAETPASYIAFDLLAMDDELWLERPLSERRARLAELLAAAKAPIHLTPASTDRAEAEQWFGRFEGAGLDGIVAKRLEEPYQPDKRTLVKVKHERTAECVVAGYRIHKDGMGVGSLLLGLYDNEDRLQHVGVAAGFSVKFRRELLAELEPRTADAMRGPPVAGLGGVAAAGRQSQARGDEPVERRKGPVVGTDPHGRHRRARRRGHVRAAREPPVPPRRLVRPLAPGPRADELPLRPARGRRPGRLRRGRRRLRRLIWARRFSNSRTCAPRSPDENVRAQMCGGATAWLGD